MPIDNDQDFIIQVTIEVDHPAPYDAISVLTVVSAAVVASMPATQLIDSNEMGALLHHAAENRILEQVLGVDPREYRKASRRGDVVPAIPGHRIAGFAIASFGNVRRNPRAYPEMHDTYGFRMETDDATD